MTTATDTVATMLVLSAAGCAPVLALVGLRPVAVPLLPLAGSVLSGAAAFCFLAIGGSFIGWFLGLATALALATLTWWTLRPDRRPTSARRSGDRALGKGSDGSALHVHHHLPTTVRVVAETAAALGVVGASAWCLRSLSTPIVGFDARAFWLMRAGWFLRSHQQALANFQGHVIQQVSYPPLVSSATSVAWYVTGNHSMRLGAVVIALLNTCALAAAAWAVVQLGLMAGHRLSGSVHSEGRSATGEGFPWLCTVPVAIGVISAVFLVFIGFGVTEPFTINGYADPLWSFAAVGAVAYGLQLGNGPGDLGAAAILLAVAGLTKNEGVVIGIGLVVLVCARRFLVTPGTGHRGRVVVGGAAGVIGIGAWPALTHLGIQLFARSPGASSLSTWPTRARLAYDGMVPHLHVIALALPVAVVGGLLLSGGRRACGVGSDWWAWAALAGGLVAIGGSYVIQSGSTALLVVTTVHRVTEYPALMAWWIIAAWAVVASGQLLAPEASSATAAEPERRSSATSSRRRAASSNRSSAAAVRISSSSSETSAATSGGGSSPGAHPPPPTAALVRTILAALLARTAARLRRARSTPSELPRKRSRMSVTDLRMLCGSIPCSAL